MHCFLRQHYLDQVNGFDLSIDSCTYGARNRSTPWMFLMVVVLRVEVKR